MPAGPNDYITTDDLSVRQTCRQSLEFKIIGKRSACDTVRVCLEGVAGRRNRPISVGQGQPSVHEVFRCYLSWLCIASSDGWYVGQTSTPMQLTRCQADALTCLTTVLTVQQTSMYGSVCSSMDKAIRKDASMLLA